MDLELYVSKNGKFVEILPKNKESTTLLKRELDIFKKTAAMLQSEIVKISKTLDTTFKKNIKKIEEYNSGSILLELVFLNTMTSILEDIISDKISAITKTEIGKNDIKNFKIIIKLLRKYQ